MRPARRVGPLSVLVAVVVSASACTGDGISISIGTSPSASLPPSPAGDDDRALGIEPVRTNETTAAGALRALCVSPESVSTSDGQPPGEPPASITQVQEQVESVRGLDYLEPVAAQPISQPEIADKLTEAFDATYPKKFYDRRTAAWHTIGLLPTDVSIRDALLAFQTGQVVGFYNPVDGELVYIGDEELDLSERFTLAHELTHAIDDQHFDLSRVDRIAGACRDEAFQAALGVIEGSAQYFASQVLQAFPDPEADVGGGGGGLPAGVPPFMAELQLWPYSEGPAFVDAIEERGGLGEVDQALTRFPETTEQILHPERFPGDLPSPVDVGDLSGLLGPGWGDLDAMQVGEVWLRAMLNLHLEGSTAQDAAAGWDGGIYRAFTDGREVAVVLATAWDSEGEAGSFAGAMADWLGASGVRGVVEEQSGTTVTTLFASSDPVLGFLRDAVRE